MKRVMFSLFLVALAICHGDNFRASNGNPIPAGNLHPQQKRKTPSLSPEQRTRRAQTFRPGRDLLERKGVPFAPDELLDPGWKKRLALKFTEMPEMQVTRRLGKRFKGVQLADVLYLPEKVELTGDTVILANYVIFEGRHAVIKGGYNVYFFPVEMEGALGSTLEAAMNEQGVQFTTVSLNNLSRARRIIPRLLQEDWSITIDTNGRGAKEWLEDQKKKRGEVGFVKASFQDQDTSGGLGATGPEGPQGLPTCNGQPDPSPGGDHGVCGAGVHGLTGFPGTPGCTGNEGGRGGQGMPGGDAGAIIATITGTTGTYRFFAKGGQGGQGGIGGIGGIGGTGATGGRGGDGQNCTCQQGGAGNGGQGGNSGRGGKGGKGGRGGKGGPGGAGADITVTTPSNFTGNIIHDGRGGPGGQPGLVGPGGTPGSSGGTGERGRGASNSNCPSSPSTSDGDPGLFLSDLGWGAHGEIGEPGDASTVHGQYYPQVDDGGDPCGGTCDLSCEYCDGYKCEPTAVQECANPQAGCYCSPIVIDVLGNGFKLTDASNGILFDMNGDGVKGQMAWTAADGDDAFLVLDRDGNGTIDKGAELFGNFTPQPPSTSPHGFLALAEYDKSRNGGNGDGVINKRDTVFSALRLWQDVNHNGISEPDELHTLPSLAVVMLDLDFKESRRTDRYGNKFAYRAKVWDKKKAKVGRWAWDIFFVPAR